MRSLVTPVHKIISGGQTGADRTGLEVAKELGLATGGCAPAGYKTEAGPDLSLKDLGLVEHPSSDYAPRTIQNAQDSDATVWFGNLYTPGWRVTKHASSAHLRPFLANPTPEYLRAWLIKIPVRVLNVAGNRESTNPDVVRRTRETLLAALTDEA